MKSQISSLYGHWLIAESISFHWQNSLKASSFHLSTEHSRQVWQSLLYVVVEGYIDLGVRNDEIDAVLGNAVELQKLRRFRNATFHYQEDPFSAKYLDFKSDPNGELWVLKLNAAFRSFFERELPDHHFTEYVSQLSQAKNAGE
ncbi:hypothetical protein [Ensifer adhaerens]|uniref:hypothetical protein n=1 Tax=Ensifer adhaerens TaxID=106592 RepID=UPI002030F74C|nr:hypothetical protein [Ensifer adhaerens]